jgi:hypothetical protein
VTYTFDVSQLDLLEPLGERGGREDFLQRVDGEHAVAVGQASEFRLAVADGHRGSALDALVAEQMLAAGTRNEKNEINPLRDTASSSERPNFTFASKLKR